MSRATTTRCWTSSATTRPRRGRRRLKVDARHAQDPVRAVDQRLLDGTRQRRLARGPGRAFVVHAVEAEHFGALDQLAQRSSVLALKPNRVARQHV